MLRQNPGTYILKSDILMSRSQWPARLRHEMSSPARTLRSLIRISLGIWIHVGVSSVLVWSHEGTGNEIELLTRPKFPAIFLLSL
jgi:hypothetical protein